MIAYTIGNETLNIRRFAVNQIWTKILDHIQIPNESLFILYCLLYWPNEARCCLGLRPSRNPNKRPLLVHTTACYAIIRLRLGRSRKTITIHHQSRYLMALLSPTLSTKIACMFREVRVLGFYNSSAIQGHRKHIPWRNKLKGVNWSAEILGGNK
jgi:hypothetical protein